MLFPTYRPEGHTGRGDKYLKDIVNELRRIVAKKQNSFSDKNLKLKSQDLRTLAICLVEFAEDLHNEIGIWKSLEYYNTQLFCTPLPLVIAKGDTENTRGISTSRVQFLLWNLYSELQPSLILSTKHPDIANLAQASSDFLRNRFVQVPKNSGIKSFLQSPNIKAWEVKKKLIWLGTRSYLFRCNFENYLSNQDQTKPEIPTIDDFICQECTHWSGLGVIDILAETINIDDAERKDLRNWYKRHMAWYKLLSVNDDQTKALNIINNETYLIANSCKPNPFKENQMIMASLVPWDGMWYWSGTQKRVDWSSEEQLKELRKDFFKQCSRIIFRYHQNYLDKANDSLRTQSKEFLDYYGNNYKLFDDGLSMAADLKKLWSKRYESAPPEVVKKVMKDHGLKNPCPDMPFPEELLNCEDGVALHFNKNEGLEIIKDMHSIIKGLKKKGKNLTKYELYLLRGLVKCDSVSVQFISFLVEQYGAGSIRSSFLTEDDTDEIGLNFLLHRFKGHFFRTRYPTTSLSDYCHQDES